VEKEAFMEKHRCFCLRDTKIQLPNGIVWKLAEAAKTKIMRITSPDLSYDDSGKNAFYSVVEFKGP
jgi:hypothetical protein